MNGISLHTQHLNASVPPVLHAALSVPLVHAATDPTWCAGLHTAMLPCLLHTQHVCTLGKQAICMHNLACYRPCMISLLACASLSCYRPHVRCMQVLQLEHPTGGQHLNDIQQLTMFAACCPQASGSAYSALIACAYAARQPHGTAQAVSEDCSHVPQF